MSFTAHSAKVLSKILEVSEDKAHFAKHGDDRVVNDDELCNHTPPLNDIYHLNEPMENQNCWNLQAWKKKE